MAKSDQQLRNFGSMLSLPVGTFSALRELNEIFSEPIYRENPIPLNLRTFRRTPIPKRPAMLRSKGEINAGSISFLLEFAPPFYFPPNQIPRLGSPPRMFSVDSSYR